MKKLAGNNRGAILVLVGASLVALFGMAALAIDIGRLYAGKSRAQDICDSAAIGGAYSLDGTAEPEGARDVASNLAQENVLARPGWIIYRSSGGRSGDADDNNNEGVTTSFPTEIWTAAGVTMTVEPGDAIQVDGWVQVDFGLARIFDILGGDHSRGTAHARAIAVIEPVDSPGNHLMNLGVSSELEASYEQGATYTIETGQWQDNWLGPGNFGAVDFGNGNAYDQISGTVENDVSIGDTIDTMPGNKVGNESKGMQYRLYGAKAGDGIEPETDYANGQYADWVADGYPTDERLVLLPIIDDDPALDENGNKPIVVVGFAAFYIDSYSITGNSSEITGVFVEAIRSGESFTVVPQLNPGTSPPIPVKTIRLVS